MDNNLELWNKVCKTNPANTKNANVRGNKITAIAPQAQIMEATKQFGSYGTGWGFKSITLNFDLCLAAGIAVFNGVFYYPKGEFPISSSISIYKDNAREKPDADFAKKVETDALTKALSKLGFNADVFMGCFDDHKYVQDMKDEFAAKTFVVDDNAKGWIEAVKKDKSVLNNIDDISYRNFIQEKAA